MRRSVVAMLCLAFITTTASSQLTLVPSFGLENAKPMVRVNNNPFITPLVIQLRPQASVRLDYKFKTGHGIFAGISTSSTAVAFNFTNPEISWVKYTAERSIAQLRLEGGYQFNTKPLAFKNNAGTKRTSASKRSCCSKSGSNSMKQESSSMKHEGTSMKPGCGMSVQRSSCGQRSKSATTKNTDKKSILSLRLQPSVGMAYIPMPKNDFETSLKGGQLTYTYNAGNWNTALITGMGFEFAKGKNKLVQVNVQYLKGLGNLDNKVLSTNAGTKSTETNFTSRVSSWKLSIGLPLSLKSSGRGHCGAARKQQPKRHCEPVRYRCGTRI